MKKITILNLDTSSVGGIQTYLKMFSKHLDENNFFKYKTFELSKRINPISLFLIFYNCIKSDYIFITHISILNLVFLIFFKKKIFFFFYGIEIWKPRSKLAKLILSNFKFKKYITCSNYSKNYLYKSLNFSNPDVSVIYPYSIFETEKKFINIYNKKKKKNFNIVSISRLGGEVTRGLWLLLNSLKLLKLKNINVDIIGIGDQKNKMEKYVKKNNIKNVYFHGYVKDLKPFYCKSDLSIYLTDETGLGISAVDSIFFNTPCLISKNSASIEVFNGLTKYTYQTRNDQDKIGMTKILNNLSKSKRNLSNFKYKSQYFNKFSKKNFDSNFKKIL